MLQTALGLAGGLVSNAIENSRQQELLQQQRNREDQLLAQQHQREDNAIQRQYEDMLKAGINPMLAGLQGGAGSTLGFTPQQAGYNTLSNSLQGISGTLNNLANSRDTFSKTTSELNKINAEVDNIKEKTETEILSRDEMKQRIANLKGEEKILAEKLVTEINQHKQQTADIINTLFQNTLMQDQHSLNLKQLDELNNRLKRQEFEEKFLWGFEKIQAGLNNVLSAEQITQVQKAWAKTSIETDILKYEHSKSTVMKDIIEDTLGEGVVSRALDYVYNFFIDLVK